MNFRRVPRLEGTARSPSPTSNTVRCFTCAVSSSPQNSSVRQKDFALIMKIVKGLMCLPEATERTEGVKSRSKADSQAEFSPLLCAWCVCSLLLGLEAMVRLQCDEMVYEKEAVWGGWLVMIYRVVRRGAFLSFFMGVISFTLSNGSNAILWRWRLQTTFLKLYF